MESWKQKGVTLVEAVGIASMFSISGFTASKVSFMFFELEEVLVSGFWFSSFDNEPVT